MASFGELIAEGRKKLGLSQKELAGRVKKEDGTPISPQYLNDLELRRRAAPSDHIIDEFARELSIDRDILYFSAGEVSPDLRDLDPRDDEVRKAITAFRRNVGRDGK
ncbi:MAG TPA: helix-turn-helix transcriptional regulator [Fimbriimonadaceae bacterium]|nr:helix-turn-helix transcriptional regulator [Fimbriimonadaceae bacterium]